jgi:hypothetical protein
MVVPKRVEARFGRCRVEPDLREYPPHGLNPHHRRALTLVRDYMRLKTGIREVVAIPLASDGIRRNAIMRQNAERFVVAAAAKLVDVVRKDLPLPFDVVQNVDLAADPLNNPNG